MQEDFNNNLQTQDKSNLPHVEETESSSDKNRLQVKSVVQTASFFSKYKFTISLIAALFIIAILVSLYFLVFFKVKEPIQSPPPDLPKAMLILNEPIDQQATTSAQITVSGKTNPYSQVVAYTTTNEDVFESDQDGNFSGVLDLDEGPNEIIITAFGNNNEEISETRSVVYVTNEEL